jgi:hypothetical protein
MIPPLASSAPTTGSGDPAAAAAVGFWLKSSLFGEAGEDFDAGLLWAAAAGSFDLDSAAFGLSASFSSIFTASEDDVSIGILPAPALAPFDQLALSEASGELLLFGLDDISVYWFWTSFVCLI